MNHSLKAVFIDRDGTINEERHYVHKVEDFAFIPGAVDALNLLQKEGITIFIITNQAGIARGIFTEEQFHILKDHMLDVLLQEGIHIEKVLYCPHHPEGVVEKYTKVCDCRKPETRLIDEVVAEYGYKLSEMAIIGDKKSDIETGKNLGITTCMVETGYGAQEKHTVDADYVVKDLLAAVKMLLRLSE